MAATGVLGIMSLDDGIDDRIEKDIIETDYDNVTIDDMIRICIHDESFEHYFENCVLTQRQMLRMLQRIKKLNARNLTGSGTSRKRTIQVQALHEYEEYVLAEEDAVIRTEVINGKKVEIRGDIYEWQEKSDYDTWYTYSYDTSDIEKLCQIDWQIIYTLQAASGDRNWNYEDNADWGSGYVEAFCGYCGKALDDKSKCPVCSYQQEIENDDRSLNEYGYCTQCGGAYDSTLVCKTCTEKVSSEVGKIKNEDIDALLDFFTIDYEYSYDAASMLKDSYQYAQSQSIPFKYHCEEETIPENDAGERRNGKYTWFESASLVMNTRNGFLYAWYDVEKDMNGNPVVTPQNLYNGRESTLEAYTVHLGVTASAMEKRGIHAERGDLNREIEVTNQKLWQLKACISKLQDWLKEEQENTASPTLADYIQGILSRKAQAGKPGYSQSLYNLKDAAKMLNFLQVNSIIDMAGLDEKFKSMIGEQLDIQGKLKPVERRLGTLKKHLEQANIYFKYKKKKALTETEQILFTTAKDYLKGVMNGKTTIPTKAWKEEYTKLIVEKKTLNQRYLAMKEEVKEAEKIRKSVYSILRQEQQPHRKQDMER